VSADPAAAAPSGVVTFLFTDVKGSAHRWEADADAMRAALFAHDEVLRNAIEKLKSLLRGDRGHRRSMAANCSAVRVTMWLPRSPSAAVFYGTPTGVRRCFGQQS
jgi:class 3 adenylate cyclase